MQQKGRVGRIAEQCWMLISGICRTFHKLQIQDLYWSWEMDPQRVKSLVAPPAKVKHLVGVYPINPLWIHMRSLYWEDARTEILQRVIMAASEGYCGGICTKARKDSHIDIIIKVNDITIDAYENFMFIIPTTERPVSLTFMQPHMQRECPGSFQLRNQNDVICKVVLVIISSNSMPTASIRRRTCLATILPEIRHPRWAFTFENEQQKEKRRLAALAAVEKRENMSNKYKGNSKFAVRSNNKTERQLFKGELRSRRSWMLLHWTQKKLTSVSPTIQVMLLMQSYREELQPRKSLNRIWSIARLQSVQAFSQPNSSQVRGAITTAAHGTMNLVGASNGEMESGSFVAPGAVQYPPFLRHRHLHLQLHLHRR